MKVFAIIFGILFALILLVTGAGYYWWKKSGEAWFDSAQKEMQDGQEAGQNIIQGACFELVLDKAKSCDAMSCSIAATLFSQGCFMSAKPDPKFCATVPTPDKWFKTAEWAAEVCLSNGIKSQYCPNILMDVGKFCSNNP